jgi:hypothetical protein
LFLGQTTVSAAASKFEYDSSASHDVLQVSRGEQREGVDLRYPGDEISRFNPETQVRQSGFEVQPSTYLGRPGSLAAGS